MTEEYEEMRKFWYSDEGVLFEIIKTLKYREAVFLNQANPKGTIRCIKSNAIRYLLANFKRYDFLKETYNLYGSLSIFPNLPMFSFNRFKKRQEMDDFNKDYLNYLEGYDFLIDIDDPRLEYAYSQLIQVKKILDEYKVPYYILFSGKKGFHCRVSYDDFPDWIKEMDFRKIEKLFKEFGENFALLNNLKGVDYGIFDLRRIAKTPYSVVYPYYFIALPLSDEDIENFSLENVSLPYWILNIDKIRNRGLLKREGTSEGFGKLIKRYTEVD